MIVKRLDPQSLVELSYTSFLAQQTPCLPDPANLNAKRPEP